MKIKKTYNFTRAIKVTPDNLKKLISFFANYYDDLSYSASLSDNCNTDFESFEKLISYNNYKKSHITSISINGKLGYNFSALDCRIETYPGMTAAYKYTVTIEYSLNTNEEAIVFDAKLNDLIDSMEMSRVYTFFSKLTSLSIFVFCILILITLIPLDYDGSITISLKYMVILIIIIFIIVPILILKLTELLDKAYSSFVPPIVFYWGEEKAVEDKNSNLRNSIFWCVIVAFFIGLIINLIT